MGVLGGLGVSLTANKALEQQSNLGKWEKGFVRYGIMLPFQRKAASCDGLCFGANCRIWEPRTNCVVSPVDLSPSHYEQEAQESVQCKDEIDHLNHYAI